MKFISTQDVYVLIVIALFRICGSIPSARFQNLVADQIGAFAYHWSRLKRQRCEANISQVIVPRPTPAQTRQIVLSGFKQVWQNQVELWRSPGESSGANVTGWEYLQAAINSNKGVILLESKALGSGYLAKRILSERGIRVHQAHGSLHLGGFLAEPITWVSNNITLPIFERREKVFVADIVYVADSGSLVFTKQLIELLQGNAVLCISGDGNVGHKKVQIPFLGLSMSFATGMINLGKFTGAALLPLYCLRCASGKSLLRIEPPLEFDPNLGRDQAVEEILTRYARLLEKRILQHPDQYRNWHLVQSDGKNG